MYYQYLVVHLGHRLSLNSDRSFSLCWAEAEFFYPLCYFKSNNKMTIKIEKYIVRLNVIFFSLDKIKDSLEQMKNEIGSISKKLNNLETSATKDEGQFPDSCYSLNVLNRNLRRPIQSTNWMLFLTVFIHKTHFWGKTNRTTGS